MQTELYIGGEWRPASDGGTFPIEDPSTEKVIAEVASATVEDVTMAVDIAHAAGVEWAKRKPRERAEVLRSAWELLTSRREQIAEYIVRENGKALPDAYGETDYAIEFFRWYAEEAVVADWQIVPAPLDCGLNLWEIAALPLRAPTAYHLWRRAEGIFRVKVSEEKMATMNVLGFGGGVSELFLMLAKARGHNAFFCSGSPERRDALEAQGIVPIDQKAFNRFASRDDSKAFVKEIRSLTGGEGMHLVCDMLRGPIFDAGFAACSRQGVIVSAGWQLTRSVEFNSAAASIKQITLDHTHYDTIEGVEAATELYGSVFKPTIHSEIYSFEDLPRAITDMHKNTQTGIPIIRVAEEMPESVAALIP